MMRLLTLPPVTEIDKVPTHEVPTEIARLLVLQAALAVRLASPLAVSQAQATNLPPRYVNAKELAKHLHLRLDGVYELARKGRIPCVRIGKRAMRFDVDTLNVSHPHVGGEPGQDVAA